MEIKSDAYINFLAQLTTSDKSELYRIGYKKTFAKNEFIFKAGDKDSNIWLLTSGRVKIFMSSVQGRDILLWFALAGSIFGLGASEPEQTRIVNALTSEEVDAICISLTKFKEWVSIRPEISYLLTKIVSARMNEIGQRFLSLANGNIQLEIAELLLRLGSNYGTQVGTELHIDVPLTVQDIADMAGSSRQGVSSCLANMKRHGIIDISHHFFILKRLDKLKRLASEKLESSPNANWMNETSKMERFIAR